MKKINIMFRVLIIDLKSAKFWQVFIHKNGKIEIYINIYNNSIVTIKKYELRESLKIQIIRWNYTNFWFLSRTGFSLSFHRLYGHCIINVYIHLITERRRSPKKSTMYRVIQPWIATLSITFVRRLSCDCVPRAWIDKT